MCSKQKRVRFLPLFPRAGFQRSCQRLLQLQLRLQDAGSERAGKMLSPRGLCGCPRRGGCVAQPPEPPVPMSLFATTSKATLGMQPRLQAPPSPCPSVDKNERERFEDALIQGYPKRPFPGVPGRDMEL